MVERRGGSEEKGLSEKPQRKTEKGKEKEYYGGETSPVEGGECMPMATAEQGELAIRRFRAIVLL